MMMDHTKPAQWFRMYAEFATDPKVQMLSEADQRRYMMLLCLRCSNGDVTLQDVSVAFQLRINDEEWAKTKAVLVTAKLVTKDNQPTAWDKRQKASDSSAARVAKHRALHKAKSNGDVTLQQRPVEKEKEKEGEKEKIKNTAQKTRADEFDDHAALIALGVASTVATDFLAIRKKKRAPLTATALEEIKREAVKAGLSVNKALEKCCARGWQGFDASWLDSKTSGSSQFLTPQQQRDENNRRSTAEFLADDSPFFGTEPEAIEGEFNHA
jgi:hypothetical protein